ncbi:MULTISPECIES: CHAT domain-containing protein [unclassified Anabaena]|uniref:CHAT domain-containing protein n=1 Tax=unclassified Anabaena TaxID=2619674 RepID=UPI0039C70C74
MGKQAILTLLRGSFEQGFPVILRIREDGAADTEIQVEGHLPPAVDILEPLENWQSKYRQSVISQERIIPRPNAVTNFSWIELSSQMREYLNNWLNSSSREWRRVRDQLLWNLSETDDEIQVLIQTNDAQLRQLPWNLWDLFSEQYRNAEIALSLPEFRPPRHRSLSVTNNVRILAILGDTTNIDVQQDRAILERLPQAKIEFLEEPKRDQLNRQLWEKHWDILFFAGHSDSNESGEIGRIYINRDDCLTLDELGYALIKGIEQGLKLAIFNSCDGLGLAHRLATWGLPYSIVMRQPVPDVIAQEFLKNFLEAFVRQKSLYMAVREAREKLQGLEKDFPYASWLPVICQNPAARPFSWSEPMHNSINELIASSGQDRLENTDQTLLFSSTQPGTELYPVSPSNSPENSDLAAAIAPDEPKRHQPRQRHLYHVIFKYFTILLIGVSIGLLTRNPSIVSNSPNSPSPRACNSPAADVSEIAFSPDGEYLVTTSLDKTVRVWKLNGTELTQVGCDESHTDGVVAVKFSPDERTIATASLDSNARLMHITDNGSIDSDSFTPLRHRYRIDNDKFVYPPVVALDFSSDGKYLASGSTDGRVRIWDTSNSDGIAFTQELKNYVKGVSFSQDGKYLAIANLNNKANVWDWEAKKMISLASEDNVIDVIFSPKDNNYLATVNANSIIQVWDMSSNSEISRLPNLNNNIINVSFSPNGEYIATLSSDNKAELWNWRLNPDAINLSNNVAAVAFSPTNEIATATTNGSVQVLQANGVTSRDKSFSDQGNRNNSKVVSIAFNPKNDDYLAIANDDGTIEIRKNENNQSK